MAGSCKQRNITLGSMKGGELLQTASVAVN